MCFAPNAAGLRPMPGLSVQQLFGGSSGEFLWDIFIL
jgi:hypothetical protein